jgi:RNA-directed DNA polymerase
VREGWRFGLYFDFSRELDLDKLTSELATLKSKLLFQSAQGELEGARIRGKFDLFVFMEGKTDPQHVQTAKSKLQIKLPIEFSKSEREIGGPLLLRMCEYYANMPHATKVVFAFDRDDPNIMKALNARTKKGEPFQRWGNNVYSFMLPVPEHRAGSENVCIELYYRDDEITRLDKNGRRLYLSSEFDPLSFKLKSNPKIHTTQRNKIKEGRPTIIDDGVFAEHGACALSKSKFAELVAAEADNFSDFDFSQFQKIFDVLTTILDD